MIDNSELNERAHKIVNATVMDKTLFSARNAMGDVRVGAEAAGADEETARAIAASIHLDPEQRKEVASSGGLLMGAMAALELQGEADG